MRTTLARCVSLSPILAVSEFAGRSIISSVRDGGLSSLHIEEAPPPTLRTHSLHVRRL